MLRLVQPPVVSHDIVLLLLLLPTPPLLSARCCVPTRPPFVQEMPRVLDLIVSLGCYDRRVTAYLATAVLISVRGHFFTETEEIAQDWQALQFFSRLNSRQITLDLNEVRAAVAACLPTEESNGRYN